MTTDSIAGDLANNETPNQQSYNRVSAPYPIGQVAYAPLLPSGHWKHSNCSFFLGFVQKSISLI